MACVYIGKHAAEMKSTNKRAVLTTGTTGLSADDRALSQHRLDGEANRAIERSSERTEIVFRPSEARAGW